MARNLGSHTGVIPWCIFHGYEIGVGHFFHTGRRPRFDIPDNPAFEL